MWDVKACRACLNTRSKLDKVSAPTKRIYSTITGVNFTDGDGYPNYLCIECFAMIKKVLAFRRKCRRAYFVLNEIMNIKKQVSLSSIDTVDRIKTNLNSQHNYSSGHNQYVYIINDAEDVCEDKPKLEEDRNDNKSDELSVNTNNETNADQNNEIEFTKNRLVAINEHSFIITDIKPESDIIEEERELDRDVTVGEVQDPDNNDEVALKDIDLEDVFKGLEEEYVESDSEFSEPELFKMPPKNKSAEVKKIKNKSVEVKKMKNTSAEVKKRGGGNESHLKRMVMKYEDLTKTYVKENIWTLGIKGHCSSEGIINKICDVLMLYKIRQLSHEEQVAAYNKKLNEDSFRLATYKCAICVKAFVTKSLLMVHSILHSRSASWNYVCKICKIFMQTPEFMHEHMCEEHMYEYQCMVCSYTTYTPAHVIKCANHPIPKPKYIEEAIERHFTKEPLPQERYGDTIKEVTGHGSYMCGQCNAAFFYKSAFLEHRSMHNYVEDNTSLICDVCRLKLPNKSALQQHMEFTHLYSYSCNHCSMVVMNTIQAQDHQCTSKTPASCPVCGLHCKNISLLAAHQLKNHFEFRQLGESWCNVCAQKFGSRYDLYHHQISKHTFLSLNDPNTDEYSNICGECKVNFVTMEAYLAHFSHKRHKRLHGESYVCNRCRTKFSSQVQRNAHKCRTAAGELRSAIPNRLVGTLSPVKKKQRPAVRDKSKSCPYCDAVLPDALAYQRHFQTAHPGLDYKHCGDYILCDMCGKSVPMKKISQHRRAHATVRSRDSGAGGTVSTWCRLCPARCASGRELVRHVLRAHTVKPYMCALCPARYKHRTKCFDHILKTHAPERPFQCTECGRQFAHHQFLLQHARRTHGVILPPAQRAKCGLFVYPYMKLNCTLIEPSIIQRLPLEICDFLDHKIKPVENYMDYAVFDPALIPEDIETGHSKRTDDDDETPKKRKTEDVTEENFDVGTVRKKKKTTVKVTGDSDAVFVDKSRLNFERVVVTSGKVTDYKLESNADMIDDLKFEDSMSSDMIVSESYELEEASVEDTDKMDDESIAEDNHEIFDDGNNQYVMIDGVLYRIEST